MPNCTASVAVVGAGDDRDRDCPSVRARGLSRVRRAAKWRKAGAAGGEIEAAGGICTGLSLDARQEDAVTDFMHQCRRGGAAGTGRVQHRRQRQFSAAGDYGAGVSKGLGTGLLCRVPDRAGGGAAHAAHGRGSIFFTGATASVRGGNGYTAFAAAKFGLRAVAQSMARELGPQNIHVAHLVIDSGVDTEWVRQRIAAGGASADDQGFDEPGVDRRDGTGSCISSRAMRGRIELDLRPSRENW